MPIRDTNFLPSILTGQDAGIRNALLERDLVRERDQRNVLARYAQAETGAEQDAAVNELLAINPEAAQGVVGMEAQRQAIDINRQAAERQQVLDEAVRGQGMARYILGSENPVLALQLLDDDEAVRTTALEKGIDPTTAEGARQIAELLDAEYDMVVQSQTTRAEPAVIREMESLGYDLTPEGFRAYQEDKGSEAGGTLAEIQALLAIDERRARLAREEREAAAAAREAEEGRRRQRSTINRALEQTGKIADLTESLEGTFLESGAPLSDWRRAGVSALATIGNIAGFDTEGLRDQVDAYDQQKKNMADQLINLMSTGGLGEATNAKLDQYQNALANPETSPGAIMAIQAGIGEILLDEADNLGIEVEDREKIESRIEAMTNYARKLSEPVADVPGAMNDLRAIASMSLEQLQGLDISKMSLEAQEAAADRWDALVGATE